MAITRQDVIHVARLARLGLADDEIDAMVRDLGRILAYVDELSQVDTTGIPPTTSPSVSAAPFRRDEQVAGVSRDDALAEAPRHGDGTFAVPGFVDEG